MDAQGNFQSGNQLQRHLSSLKVISRLLGHELHNQGGARSISLSREEVAEIQTTLDLFIEEAGKRMTSGGGGMGTGALASDTQLVPARN
ncbi:MAG: hypothetical protein GY711_19535 [bacterium]|nr:hypothetical protein [bacterium]